MRGLERRDPRACLDWRSSASTRPRAVIRKSSQKDKATIELPAELVCSREPAVATVVAILDAPGGQVAEADLQLLKVAQHVARSQGGAVLVPAWVDTDEDKLAHSGADYLVRVSCPADACEREAMTQALGIINCRHALTCVIFHSAIGRSGDVGRRFVAQSGAQVTNSDIAMSDSRGVRQSSGAYHVAWLASATLRRDEPAPPDAEVSVIEAVTIDGTLARYTGTISHDRSNLALSEAQFILAAGTGVQDWQSFYALAHALSATIGATRAVCDAGLLARDRQIGASGQIVSPECYIALGISGAPQHVQGLRQCEQVIAVNTDLHAAMMKRADLAIVADVQHVMPALLRILETQQ